MSICSTLTKSLRFRIRKDKNMKRAASLSLRALLAVSILGFSVAASALPLSPKWMKSNVALKATEPTRAGDLGDGAGAGVVGGNEVSRMPMPGSIWLILIGAAGFALQRRAKSSR
jgi:hypothetical protein